MKRSKKICLLALVTMLFICTLAFSGCAKQAATIVGVEKIDAAQGENLYLITYSDGSESVIEVKGDDSEEPQSTITIDDIYNKYLENNPNATYEDFIKKYLTVSSDNTLVINKSVLSSIKLYAEFTERAASYPYGSYTTSKSVSSGSGVIYKIDADYVYFITNYHVVFNKSASPSVSKNIHCYLYGSEGAPQKSGSVDLSGLPVYDYGSYAIKCEYVGGSLTADLAVIRAQTKDVLSINSSVSQVTFADGYSVGEAAIAIGNTEDEGISVTEGVVSVDNEYINLSLDGTTRQYRALRIDTAIYSGNSGGGLFNADGKLIGITNAGDNKDQNVNFAIPVDIVKAVTENIMYYFNQGTSPKKGLIGITVNNVNAKYVFDSKLGAGKIVEDVIVSKVALGGVADKMGVKVGDEIVSITVNSYEDVIDRYFEISDLLYTVRSGDKIKFTIKRDGKLQETSIYEIKESDLTTVF